MLWSWHKYGNITLNTPPSKRCTAYREVEVQLGIRWRWAVSFIPRLLYLQGKYFKNPLNRRLGEPHSQTGHSGNRMEIKERFLCCSASRLVTTLTALLAHEFLYEQYTETLMEHPRGRPRSGWAHRLEDVTQKTMGRKWMEEKIKEKCGSRMVQITADGTKMNYITGHTSYKKKKRTHITLNWGGNVTSKKCQV